MNNKVVFKPSKLEQISMFPTSLGSMIDANHPVRVIDSIIEKINIDVLIKNYAGGGASSYHPRMMLKLLVYSYLQNIYSSRKIEEMCRESVPFMWLTGNQAPDHNSICRFRSSRLKGIIKNIFVIVVKMLYEQGVLDISDVYLDGTKLEANANKYSFVWRKSIINRKAKMLHELEQIWKYVESMTASELKDTSPIQYGEINPDVLAATVNSLNEALSKLPPEVEVDKKKLKRLRDISNHWPEQLSKYSHQLELMGNRNSYSKTDIDATFMRMKDDNMGNGQLKAGYNFQISTNNQMILNYSVHQTPGDTSTFIIHLEDYYNNYGISPTSVTADAGYGSEENYQYLEGEYIDGFVKYNTYHKETLGKDNHINNPEKYHYNSELDCYYCPIGQQMRRIKEGQRRTDRGFIQNVVYYQAQNCSRCPLNGACHKSQGNRIIEVNYNGRRLRKKAKDKLLSDEGKAKSKRRSIEPETVFGNIKQNKRFTRFYLRGIDKVDVELGLLSIAHNLGKLCVRMGKN